RRGLVDDRAFALSLCKRLRRRGSSARRIRAGLIGRGVSDELADEVLGCEAGETPDLVAACRYARRRRLGPYRGVERHERDLAALARAGFSRDIADRVLGAEDPEALDDIIEASEGRDA
ncbi:MAG: RecX family transcriptional regulator, partial [Deltaproteobacteria bacterium]|nr:RecX family transcriptional regulator [Deltaproteobacteria bacterium]MBW2420639.1 RecX family transcriptional regulator [Deltaproteobacteria bacterium]